MPFFLSITCVQTLLQLSTIRASAAVLVPNGMCGMCDVMWRCCGGGVIVVAVVEVVLLLLLLWRCCCCCCCCCGGGVVVVVVVEVVL